jgi:hypothetical protein
MTEAMQRQSRIVQMVKPDREAVNENRKNERADAWPALSL